MENPPNNQMHTKKTPFATNDATPNIQQPENSSVQQQLQQSIKQDYQVLKKLGSGAYGHVWKVKNRRTQQIFALKKVFSAFQNDTDAQRTYRQIVYLKKLSQHQNIVRLHRVIRANNDMDIYLLFEYMQSDLFYAIKENLLNDLHKKYIIYQIAKGLKYVHSAGMVHRDVKPSNILLNPNCDIKLCDFGLSRSLWRYNNEEAKLTEFIATRWYRAPQVLFGSQFYNTQSDMWSVGCLIYELYAGRPLLPGNDTVQQIHKVLQFKGYPNIEETESFRVQQIDEILNLFDIQKKPLNEYFQYVPLQQVKQLLIHLLEYNPSKRWTAENLLNSSFLEQFRKQLEISADKQVKTGINDNQKKSVDVYRNVIYNQFIFDDAQKCQNIKHKLRLIRDDKRDSTFRGSVGGRKNFVRESSREMLTEQRKPNSLVNTKVSASLHMSKGNKNRFSNTQRLSHRKNMSSHSLSKYNSGTMENYKTAPQKPLFLQMKPKMLQPKFQKSKNMNTIKRTRKSLTKQQQNKQQRTFHYEQQLRSSVQNSVSKTPKIIQQKINRQRNILNNLKNQQTSKSTSKLLRTSMAKQKRSPYVAQLEKSASKVKSSEFSFAGKKVGMGSSLNANNNDKQNFGTTHGGVRKLKRKGIVN